MGADPLRVVFVCWGNICRSPMAERVAERMAADQGLTGVEFTSAATSREELGAPIDRRAEAVLREHGYRVDGHTAHQITRDEIENADLVIAMEDIHVTRMMGLAPEASNVSLLTDYDPGAEPGSGVPDPVVRHRRRLLRHADGRGGGHAGRSRPRPRAAGKISKLLTRSCRFAVGSIEQRVKGTHEEVPQPREGAPDVRHHSHPDRRPLRASDCTPAQRVTRSLLGYGVLAGPFYVITSARPGPGP